jgi:hypothetical protein
MSSAHQGSKWPDVSAISRKTQVPTYHIRADPLPVCLDKLQERTRCLGFEADRDLHSVMLRSIDIEGDRRPCASVATPSGLQHREHTTYRGTLFPAEYHFTVLFRLRSVSTRFHIDGV